jgi:TolB-like protein/tetratricopeptide (TPR) repeat protein
LRDAPAGVADPAAQGPSIAVLPLANLSTDPADAALADGMTEELIGVLGRTGSLRVIASTSVFALRDRRMDVRQIADSLRVSHILEGGLQKIGSRLRMQVRLVDARDGSTRWSETYDREFEDVFAVQEEIARGVANELDVRLAGGSGRRSTMPGRHTRNVAAYEWYLRGMDNALLRTADGKLRGIEYFQRAIAADSTYAAAYAGLARTYIAIGAAGTQGDSRAWFSRGEEAARRAVALDDSLGQAHQALGWVHMSRWDFPAAEAEFRRAVALDPQVSFTHEGLAHIYLWTGRPAEQLAEARLALEKDPYSHTAIREMARALFANGRCDEALDRLAPLKELSPPSPVAGITGGQCHAHEGRWPEAIAEFRWAEEHSAPAAPAFLAYALARAGRRDEAEAILSDLLSGRRASHGAFGIAVVYAGLGDYDQAFAWLDRALDEKSITRDLMLPVFDDLHRDPRFERVKTRLGL